MEIEIWDNKKMKEWVSRTKHPIAHDGRTYSLFQYFGPHYSQIREVPKGDSPLSAKMDRTIVAFERKDLEFGVKNIEDMFGIFTFHFERKNCSHYYYTPGILEVRMDKWGQRIATRLIQRLNQPCFLWGRTLMIKPTDYTPDGQWLIKPIIERTLDGNLFNIMEGSY